MRKYPPSKDHFPGSENTHPRTQAPSKLPNILGSKTKDRRVTRSKEKIENIRHLQTTSQAERTLTLAVRLRVRCRAFGVDVADTDVRELGGLPVLRHGRHQLERSRCRPVHEHHVICRRVLTRCCNYTLRKGVISAKKNVSEFLFILPIGCLHLFTHKEKFANTPNTQYGYGGYWLVYFN